MRQNSTTSQLAVRGSVADGEQLPEPTTYLEDDDDQPTWCTSEYFDVKKLPPKTFAETSNGEKKAGKESKAGGNAAVVPEPLLEQLPEMANGNGMDNSLSTLFDVDNIKNTDDSSSVHSSAHQLDFENRFDE